VKIRTKLSILEHTPVIHGGKNHLQLIDSSIIDFSSNICPIGTPLSVKKSIKKKYRQYQKLP
jgi:histidinol-phosphate/aromatic aminotransferase/cobyric acid decarboxylase-like protein